MVKTNHCMALSVLVSISFMHAKAQVDPIGKDRVAVGGYDVVAYFDPGKATKGNTQITSNYKGAIYYFATEESKKTFVKSPEKYLPQYDGYCALAVGAQNKKVSINPETFKITDGRLYLFYNASHALSGNTFNSLEPWIKNEAELIRKSDANWPTLKQKKK